MEFRLRQCREAEARYRACKEQVCTAARSGPAPRGACAGLSRRPGGGRRSRSWSCTRRRGQRRRGCWRGSRMHRRSRRKTVRALGRVAPCAAGGGRAAAGAGVCVLARTGWLTRWRRRGGAGDEGAGQGCAADGGRDPRGPRSAAPRVPRAPQGCFPAASLGAGLSSSACCQWTHALSPLPTALPSLSATLPC
jgi:hypothetical protein